MPKTKKAPPPADPVPAAPAADWSIRELTMMQHRGLVSITSCPDCGADPDVTCAEQLGGVSADLAVSSHLARFLNVPRGSELRRGVGRFANGVGNPMLPVLPLVTSPVDLPRYTDEPRPTAPAPHPAGRPELDEPLVDVASPPPPVGDVPQPVPVEELVFDPELQMRARINDDTIEDYAQRMRDGVRFPPIRVVRDDGRLLVVDGWHRGLAARRAELATIEGIVRPGTRRDAILAAIAANGDHGLQRTNDDKRRAVLTLLRDAEWCALSSRAVAEAARVTHTYVNNLRERYGVSTGEVLTDEAVFAADGSLPERYEQIAKGTEWLRQFVGKVYSAKKLKQLASLHAHSPHGPALEAVRLRLEDLAVAAWPWPEVDPEDRQHRAAKLDTLEDLARAILSRDCPVDRTQLLTVWHDAGNIGRLKYKWDFERAYKTFKGRTALLAAVRARKAAVESAEESSTSAEPGNVAARLMNAPLDEQLVSIAAASDVGLLDVLVNRAGHLVEDARWALRARLSELGMLQLCTDPSCVGGFGMRHGERSYGLGNEPCWRCRQWANHAVDSVRKSLDHAARLVASGVPVRAAGVVVDRSAVELLRAVDACTLLHGAGFADMLDMLPAFLRDELVPIVHAAAERRRALAELAAEEAAAAPPTETSGDDEDGEDVNNTAASVNSTAASVNGAEVAP